MRDAHREREGGRHGHRHSDNESGAVGTQLSPKEYGKAGDIIGKWQQAQSTR